MSELASTSVPEETVEALPLRSRIRRVGRIGATVGAVMGVLVALAAAPWLASKAIVTGEEGSFTPAVEVIGSWVIAGHALVSFFAGAILAGVIRAVAGRMDRGMRLISSATLTGLVGAIAGAALGAFTAVVVLSFGEVSEATEGATVVPVFTGLVWSVLGWAFTGWVIGAVGQLVGVPRGVRGEEASELDEVKHRLSSAVGIPLVVIVAILGLVLPLAFVFIEFPSWAPLLGIFVAVSILAFAGITASRPGIKVSTRDFVVAILGIATVIIVIVAVLAAQDGGEAAGGAEGSVAVLI